MSLDRHHDFPCRVPCAGLRVHDFAFATRSGKETGDALERPLGGGKTDAEPGAAFSRTRCSSRPGSGEVGTALGRGNSVISSMITVSTEVRMSRAPGRKASGRDSGW